MKGLHLKLLLEQDDVIHECLEWNSPNVDLSHRYIDVAYNISNSYWMGESKIQLEIKALRPSNDKIIIRRNGRNYNCSLISAKQVEIVNNKGEKIVIELDDNQNIAGNNPILSHKYIKSLVKECLLAFGIVP